MKGIDSPVHRMFGIVSLVERRAGSTYTDRAEFSEKREYCYTRLLSEWPATDLRLATLRML